MDRLTEFVKRNGKDYVRIKGTKTLYNNAERKNAPASNVVVRLAAYEDAEEQGLLVRLPCKVGDTVFFWSETIYGEMYVARSRVANIVITGNAMILVDTDGCYHYTYWFTREEAEAAMKEEKRRCLEVEKMEDDA